MHISIIEISVENFKIFREKVTFSMVARKNKKHTFRSNGEDLLKASFIYGPNASGKTTLLDAVTNIRQAILFSANNRGDAPLPYVPFLAQEDSSSKPATLEVCFSLEGKNKGIYRYSFSFFQDRIVGENMTKILSSGEEKLYIARINQEFTIDKVFRKGVILAEEGNVRKESLFLSMAAQYNDEFAQEILDAFNDVNVVKGDLYPMYRDFTIKKFKEDPVFKQKILEYLQSADFCVTGGRTEEMDVKRYGFKDDSIEGFIATKNIEKGNVIFLEHPVYDVKNKKKGSFKLRLEQESIGTQRFFSALGPVVDTLQSGKVLIIDEFDNSLHPLLTKRIVDLFESPEINVHNAQLIVTTHDTSLLSYKDEFIRDQFWFTEKDEQGASRIFSLAEFNIRNDTEYGNKYLEGRFGALPFIKSLKK